MAALSLVLGGCAGGARTSGMTVFVPEEPPIDEGSLLYHGIVVTQASVGEDKRRSEGLKVPDEDFRRALENSLAANALLAKEDPASFQLRAALTLNKRSGSRFATVVAATIQYSLVNVATAEVSFDRQIENTYTARYGDDPEGDRLRLANEGAVRENIEEFILRLTEEVATNPAFGVTDR
ncbi:MAG: hypothetical protein JSV45_14745 [Chromatiales bacterium]|nr:MAG: hypothetical protein JSV45_14745 [Chromatiales bacterium]